MPLLTTWRLTIQHILLSIAKDLKKVLGYFGDAKNNNNTSFKEFTQVFLANGHPKNSDVTSVYIYIYTKPSAPVWYETMIYFKAKFNMFEISVFLLLDWWPYKGSKAHSALLFIHCWTENYWIHSFSKGITVTWTTNSIV